MRCVLAFASKIEWVKTIPCFPVSPPLTTLSALDAACFANHHGEQGACRIPEGNQYIEPYASDVDVVVFHTLGRKRGKIYTGHILDLEGLGRFKGGTISLRIVSSAVYPAPPRVKKLKSNS